MSLPTVAIVGRPNVGKSTLVNRILGRREAIVEERPGVTRDRKEVTAEWMGREFTLIDTGGWMTASEGDALDAKVSKQSEQAIAEADVVIVTADASVGVTADDELVANLVRRVDAPVLLVGNKVDSEAQQHIVWDLLSLGLGDPYPISALHGIGVADLLDEIITQLPEVDEEELDDEEEDRVFSVSIVGRPNVGKSTLFNHLIGEDRAVVHDRPGTTRDAIDTVVETPNGPVRFVDTAGMRRKARVDEETEYYSLVRALRAVDASDVALLVIDSTVGVTAQDQRLAERVDVAGCPTVVLLNKWELLNADERRDMDRMVERKLHFLGESPIIKISAINGKSVHKLWPALQGAITDYSTRIPTRKVNQLIRSAQASQPAPEGGRVLYATQGATDPPTFTLFTNKELPRTYLRYLERRLREEFDLGQTPIKLRVRRRSD
ncbi:MAG: ribosome biogenesis GTPase Der [Acidimicrobiales bacterium]|nr:MAG: ribosome biogenesis GTPase Der [Acidimicrobiales bacterium]